MPKLNDLNEVTCAACGHAGKPIAKKPGGMAGNVAEHIPGMIGVAISAGRAASTRLHCAKCGEIVNTSIIDKGVDGGRIAIDKGRNAARSATEKISGFVRRTVSQRETI
jgi:ribosomal protein S27E